MNLQDYYKNRLSIKISEISKAIDVLVKEIEKLKTRKTSTMNAKSLAAHAINIESKEKQLNFLLESL